MFKNAASIVETNKDILAKSVTQWVIDNYPERTTEYDKCTRDVRYIITAMVFCLKEGDTTAIDNISRTFFNRGVLQLKSLRVEFEAYTFLVMKLKNLS